VLRAGDDVDQRCSARPPDNVVRRLPSCHARDAAAIGGAPPPQSPRGRAGGAEAAARLGLGSKPRRSDTM
jgi:hypothetical protein